MSDAKLPETKPMTDPRTDSERACLARLTEMDDALVLMQRELPDDVQPVGDEARRTVAIWRDKLSRGGADMKQLSAAMDEISSLMDALTARLLLVPWEGRPARGKPS